jgi:hypothetical protein
MAGVRVAGALAWDLNSLGSCRKDTMLWGVAVVFLILWISGMVGAWAMGWLVHLFLVLAIVAVVLQVLRGTKASG